MRCPAGDAWIAERGRFRDSDLFRKVFEGVVARCIAEGLVGDEHFAADADLIAADVNKLNSTAKEDWDLDAIHPETAPRAVVEYLFALDDAAFGAATEVTPKFVSHADPSSQRTVANHGPAYFAHSNSYLIDIDNAVIPSRACEHALPGSGATFRPADRCAPARPTPPD